MANKFTYHHATSEVVQVATMEKPIRSDFQYQDLYDLASVQYKQHLSALARYAARGFAPEDDGKEFEEGVGFGHLYQVYSTHFTNDEWQDCTKDDYESKDHDYKRIIAVRIPDKVEAGEFDLAWKISNSTDKPFFVDTIRKLIGQYDNEQISLSKFVEELNITAFKWHNSKKSSMPDIAYYVPNEPYVQNKIGNIPKP